MFPEPDSLLIRHSNGLVVSRTRLQGEGKRRKCAKCFRSQTLSLDRHKWVSRVAHASPKGEGEKRQRCAKTGDNAPNARNPTWSRPLSTAPVPRRWHWSRPPRPRSQSQSRETGSFFCAIFFNSNFVRETIFGSWKNIIILTSCGGTSNETVLRSTQR